MSTEKNITVVIKNVGEPARTEQIPNTLPAKQKIVGGRIECLNMLDVELAYDEPEEIAARLDIICNEEGLICNLPLNVYTGAYNAIFGNLLIAGIDIDGEEFRSLTSEEIEFALTWLENHSA